MAVAATAGAGIGTSPPGVTANAVNTDAAGYFGFGTGTSIPGAPSTLLVIRLIAMGGDDIDPRSGSSSIGSVVNVFPANDAAAALGLLVAFNGIGEDTFNVTCHVAPAASQAAGFYWLGYTVTTRLG